MSITPHLQIAGLLLSSGSNAVKFYTLFMFAWLSPRLDFHLATSVPMINTELVWMMWHERNKTLQDMLL